MKIHEFQAKQILANYGVAVPKGRVAASAEEASAIARELGGRVVVKAQIHAGGRGKGGGVKLSNSPDEAARVFGQIMGMQKLAGLISTAHAYSAAEPYWIVEVYQQGINYLAPAQTAAEGIAAFAAGMAGDDSISRR